MKIDAQLRAARTQDMAACAAILNDWIDDTDWMPRVHSHDDVVRHYQTVVASERKSFVVIAGNKIVGMMTVTIDDRVTALYVSRTYRGQGVGRLLLDRAKRDADTTVTLWTFQKNTAAQAFYVREGFVEINRTDGDNEEGLPDLLMEWRG
jgi:ribosomal protein S18 acetylase RimI-like enzyme